MEFRFENEYSLALDSKTIFQLVTCLFWNANVAECSYQFSDQLLLYLRKGHSKTTCFGNKLIHSMEFCNYAKNGFEKDAWSILLEKEN